MNRANRAPAARSAPRRFFNHFNGSRGAFIIRDGWRRSRFSPARPPARPLANCLRGAARPVGGGREFLVVP